MPLAAPRTLTASRGLVLAVLLACGAPRPSAPPTAERATEQATAHDGSRAPNPSSQPRGANDARLHVRVQGSWSVDEVWAEDASLDETGAFRFESETSDGANEELRSCTGSLAPELAASLVAPFRDASARSEPWSDDDGPPGDRAVRLVDEASATVGRFFVTLEPGDGTRRLPTADSAEALGPRAHALLVAVRRAADDALCTTEGR